MNTTTFTIEKVADKGAYNANRYLYTACHYNKNREIVQSNKAILPKEMVGGIITFPTQKSNEKILMNNLAEYLNKNRGRWSIGNFFHGSYHKTTEIFDSSALSVAIPDITPEKLLDSAKNFCNLYSQNCLLVKDFSQKCCYFIFADFKNKS